MNKTTFNIDREIRRHNRQARLEEKTPLVVYQRRGPESYGLARLASIRSYLSVLGGWPPDYSQARIVTNAADLKAIQQAEVKIRAARKQADAVYRTAFARGQEIEAAAAEAAEKAADR